MPESKKLEHHKHLDALTEISRAVTSESYLEDILKLIVMVTAKVMNSNICSLMLLNQETGELEVRATQSVSDEYLKKSPIKLGEGICGLAVKEGHLITVWDVKEDDRYINKEVARVENLCSLLSVPLSVKGKVVGVINCYTSLPHEFTREEMTVLTAVANQAAMAIENTNLIMKSRLLEEELETRKLIERAKDILMEERDISGYEAFNAIRKKSMDTRRPLREIAEAIILANEV